MRTDSCASVAVRMVTLTLLTYASAVLIVAVLFEHYVGKNWNWPEVLWGAAWVSAVPVLVIAVVGSMRHGVRRSRG